MSLSPDILNNIVFCDVDIEITQLTLLNIHEELVSYPKEFWYWCTYRKCFLLPLYGNDNILNKEKIAWFGHAKKNCPNLISFIDEQIGVFFRFLPRIIVLKTEAGKSIPPHIDCNPEEIGFLNPKLRLSISGPGARLQFLSEEGKYVEANPQKNVYYMSGAYTHRLINKTNEDRLTVCFGAPWVYDSAFPIFYEKLLIKEKNAILGDSLGYVPHKSFAKDWSKHKLVNQG